MSLLAELNANAIVIIIAVVVNILSVVGVVICNKYIIEKDHYNFSVFLSFLHFAFTAFSTRVMLLMGTFSYTPAPISGILPVAVGSLLSVGFMNLNLASNSVGFYQISKLACIPFILSVQYIFYGQIVSRAIQLTLVPIIFGVAYATVYEIDLNLYGFIIASCAVIATAMAQIFTNTYQKSLNCDALQLLYHTSPYIAVGMLAMSPMFDDWSELVKYEYSNECMIRIGVTCILALGVNISNYIVLGKTSPLTYQVLGHMKTVLILILGFVFFNKVADYRNIFGIGVAMVGVVTYTEITRRQNASQPVLPTSTKK